MSDDRAGSTVAAGLALQDAAGGLTAVDAVSADGASTAPDRLAEPDFAPVSVDSLRRVLDGLRRLS